MVITTSGHDWETVVESLFPFYEKLGLARLAMLPLPMAPAGRGKFGLLYRIKGKSPFDVYGWHMRDGLFIAAELKRTERRNTLPITPPRINGKGKLVIGKGGGVHTHQLEALAAVARSGGMARLLWNNGGEVGVLSNEGLINAWENHEPALAELSGEAGIKSLKWSSFSSSFALFSGGQVADWLELSGLPVPRQSSQLPEWSSASHTQ